MRICLWFSLNLLHLQSYRIIVTCFVCRQKQDLEDFASQTQSHLRGSDRSLRHRPLCRVPQRTGSHCTRALHPVVHSYGRLTASLSGSSHTGLSLIISGTIFLKNLLKANRIFLNYYLFFQAEIFSLPDDDPPTINLYLNA